MAYPASLDSFTANTDGVDEVIAADVNELQTAIVAIETELGADPAGTAANVVTRLAIATTPAGYLKLTPGDTKTIATGVITITGNYHKVDTEAEEATDDLDTINGFAAGGFLTLVSVNDARDVVIKHGIGNVYCAGGNDITLGSSYEIAMLVYDVTNTRWMAFKSPGDYSIEGNIAGGGIIETAGFTLTVPATGTAALLGTANVFTADQTITDKNIILGTTTGTKIGTATTQKLAFYNSTPIVKPTALTTQLTSITHTAPGTPDYALQDLVQPEGFGFVTKDEGNSVLSVILNLQTRLSELETKLKALGLIA